MDPEELALKYLEDHARPVKKLEQFGSKLFLAPLSEEQCLSKEKCLEDVEKVLRQTRVDRRCGRASAVWLPEENLAKVTKIVRGIAGFGVQDKNGKFLNAEETLFLMEMNKLEVSLKGIPMSIEQAYRNIDNFSKYLILKKLALQGYKIKEVENTGEPPEKKQKLEEQTNVGCFTDVFQKLRDCGPATRTSDNQNDPIFTVEPPNKSKERKFNLTIETKEKFNSEEGVVGFPTGNDICFYKFYNTNIPIL